MSKRTKILLGIGFLLIVAYALAQTFQAPGLAIPGNGTMVGGSDYTANCSSNGVAVPCFHPLATTAAGVLQTTGVTAGAADPCASPAIAKSSAAINISTATTTSLVGVSGSTTVYVCGLSVTISEVVTTANTIQFEYGTGAACTGPTVLTGPYGAGGVTAAAPITVSYGSGNSTIFKSAASNGVCALTAIGATGNFAGVISYVQQ